MVTRVTAAVAASLASGGTEKVGFLNDMIEQLWSYINVIGASLTREFVEPMFEQMLPGPLSSLKFTKIDLGKKPIILDNIDVHQHKEEGVMKLDIDIFWDGQCDIELACKYLGSFGVQSIKLAGRVSVIMAPLVNHLPLVSAIQIGFINPPLLRLDFTGLAEVAEFSLIEKTIYKIIDNILADMLVLPNRILVKLDPASNWYDTFQMDLGVLRLNIERGYGFEIPKQFFKDIPDIYVQTRVGALKKQSTEVIKNSVEPEWNESFDWLLSDHDQDIILKALDSDFSSADDSLGIGHITVGKLLLKGGAVSLPLLIDNVDTGAKIDVSSKVFDFTLDLSSFSDEKYGADNALCGVMNVLVAGVRNLPVKREEASSYIKIKAFDKKYQTMVVGHQPDVLGLDALNPRYDAGYRFPLTQKMVNDADDIELTLMNRKTKLGVVSIPFDDVQNAENGMLSCEHELGNDAVVLYCIIVRGLVESSNS